MRASRAGRDGWLRDLRPSGSCRTRCGGYSLCPSVVFPSVLRFSAHVLQSGASRVPSYSSASVGQRVQMVLFDSPVVSQGLSPVVASVSMVLWYRTEPVPAGCCNTAAGVSTLSYEPRVRHSGSVIHT